MRFYVLEQDNHSKQYATEIYGTRMNQGDSPTCPKCGANFGPLRWLPPYHIELTLRGRDFGDIVEGPGMSLLVTDAFKNAWTTYGLNGLNHFESVTIDKIVPKRAIKHVPRYWVVMPQRDYTAVDLERTTYKRIIGGPITCYYHIGGFDAIAGIVIDQDSWTGADIFIPRNKGGTIVVTQRFADMIAEHHLTHAILIPTEKYIFDPLHLITPYSKHKN